MNVVGKIRQEPFYGLAIHRGVRIIGIDNYRGAFVKSLHAGVWAVNGTVNSFVNVLELFEAFYAKTDVGRDFAVAGCGEIAGEYAAVDELGIANVVAPGNIEFAVFYNHRMTQLVNVLFAKSALTDMVEPLG